MKMTKPLGAFMCLIAFLFSLPAMAGFHGGGKTLCLVHNLYQDSIPAEGRSVEVNALFAQVAPACVESAKTYTREWDKYIHTEAYFDIHQERIDALIALEAFVPPEKQVNVAFMKLDDSKYREWLPAVAKVVVATSGQLDKRYIANEADPSASELLAMYGDNDHIVGAYHNAIAGYAYALTAITSRQDIMDGIDDAVALGLYHDMQLTFARLRPEMTVDVLTNREHPRHYEVVHKVMGLSIQFLERMSYLEHMNGDEEYASVYHFARAYVLEGIALGPERVCGLNNNS